MSKKYRVSSKRKESYRLTYSIYDFYHMYNEENGTSIDKDLYLKISKEFNKLLIEDKVIKNRKRAVLPFLLGTIRIAKIKKHRCKLVDFHASKLYNKTIYHTNLHTNGSLFAFHWEKLKSLPNNQIYTFSVKAETKDVLVKEIKTCANDPYLPDYEALPR